MGRQEDSLSLTQRQPIHFSSDLPRGRLVEEVVEASSPGRSPVVRLTCADDDAQGQSLNAFWDYESERRIRPVYNAPLI